MGSGGADERDRTRARPFRPRSRAGTLRSMPAPTLVTDRLVLRELDPADPADRRFVLELVQDPGFVRHIADLGITDEAGAADYVERACARFYRERDFGMQAVCLRGPDDAAGEPTGILGLLERPVLPAPDLGFAFLARHRRQGYGREAGEACLADARARLGLDRVLAVTGEDNVASLALLGRLGFERGGPVRLDPAAPPALLLARTWAC